MKDKQKIEGDSFPTYVLLTVNVFPFAIALCLGWLTLSLPGDLYNQ